MMDGRGEIFVQLWLVADGRSRVDVLVPLACALALLTPEGRPAPFVSRQVGPSSALPFQPACASLLAVSTHVP